MAKKIELLITKDGHVRCIHSDEVMPLLTSLGRVTLRRASHVEPSANLSDEAVSWLRIKRWGEMLPLLAAGHGEPLAIADNSRIRELLPAVLFWADLLPVEGPVLGPFQKKQQALDAEAAWLRDHGFPVCPTGECCNAPPAQESQELHGEKN